MDYMKLVADLCQIIDRQNEITKAMVVQLGQRDALRYEEEMAAVRRDYDTAMGGGGSVQKLIETLSTVSMGQALTGGVTVVALVSVFIEITPVKINPVSKFLAWLGRKINSEVIAKVDRLETEVQAMRKADGEQEAVNCRYRILRFGDEVKHGTRHSQEHFEQILADIDAYEIYCKDHKDFKNNKTKVTTERILDVYRKCVETDDFL